MARTGDSSKSSDLIDDSLKQVYQEALEEQLPDRFTDLIAKLREKDNGTQKTDKDA